MNSVTEKNDNVPKTSDLQELPSSAERKMEEDILMFFTDQGEAPTSAKKDELLSSPGGNIKEGPEGPTTDDAREARRKMRRKEHKKRHRLRKRMEEKETKRQRKEGQDQQVQATNAVAGPSTSSASDQHVADRDDPSNGCQDRRRSRGQAQPPTKVRGPKASIAKRATTWKPFVLPTAPAAVHGGLREEKMPPRQQEAQTKGDSTRKAEEEASQGCLLFARGKAHVSPLLRDKAAASQRVSERAPSTQASSHPGKGSTK